MRYRAGLVVMATALVVVACGSSTTPVPSVEQTTPPPAVETPAPSVAEATPEVTATPAPAYTIYVVKKGDTLYAIALAHGTSVKKILAANPAIKDPQKLRIGQKITIPTS